MGCGLKLTEKSPSFWIYAIFNGREKKKTTKAEKKKNTNDANEENLLTAFLDIHIIYCLLIVYEQCTSTRVLTIDIHTFLTTSCDQ